MFFGDICVCFNVDVIRVGNVVCFINYVCDGGNLLFCLVRVVGFVIFRLVLYVR